MVGRLVISGGVGLAVGLAVGLFAGLYSGLIVGLVLGLVLWLMSQFLGGLSVDVLRKDPLFRWCHDSIARTQHRRTDAALSIAGNLDETTCLTVSEDETGETTVERTT